MDIVVENIKCDGCAGTITKKLSEVFNTDNIQVDLDTGRVSIDTDENQKDLLVEVLKGLGYPQVDSVSGFNSTKAKARSFVSCAIGKINK
jgi:copper chaperone CopZ